MKLGTASNLPQARPTHTNVAPGSVAGLCNGLFRPCNGIGLTVPTLDSANPAIAAPAALDFPGRVSLRVEEAAAKLGVTSKHLTDLIIEGKLAALDVRGRGASRACYRIPIEAYRDFIVRSLTTPADRIRLLRDLPRATLVELQRELKALLAA